MDKVDVMKERILDINPQANVDVHKCFFLPENADAFPFDSYDYIVDAVDTVTAKIELVVRAEKLRIPIISSMGTGNKLDPTRFEVTDIYKTSICPLAKVMRKELRARGVKKLKVVYSKEKLAQRFDFCSCFSLPWQHNFLRRKRSYKAFSAHDYCNDILYTADFALCLCFLPQKITEGGWISVTNHYGRCDDDFFAAGCL